MESIALSVTQNQIIEILSEKPQNIRQLSEELEMSKHGVRGRISELRTHGFDISLDRKTKNYLLNKHNNI